MIRRSRAVVVGSGVEYEGPGNASASANTSPSSGGSSSVVSNSGDWVNKLDLKGKDANRVKALLGASEERDWKKQNEIASRLKDRIREE